MRILTPKERRERIKASNPPPEDQRQLVNLWTAHKIPPNRATVYVVDSGERFSDQWANCWIEAVGIDVSDIDFADFDPHSALPVLMTPWMHGTIDGRLLAIVRWRGWFEGDNAFAESTWWGNDEIQTSLSISRNTPDETVAALKKLIFDSKLGRPERILDPQDVALAYWDYEKRTGKRPSQDRLSEDFHLSASQFKFHVRRLQRSNLLTWPPAKPPAT